MSRLPMGIFQAPIALHEVLSEQIDELFYRQPGILNDGSKQGLEDCLARMYRYHGSGFGSRMEHTR